MSGNQTIRRARKDRDNPYKPMRRATFEDRDLSFEARGVLGYILVKPDDWKINISDLMIEGGIGRDKAYRLLNELITARYCERIEVRERGRIVGYDYLVYEEPLPEKPDTVLPLTEKSLPVLSLPVLSLPENTDHTKEEPMTNKELVTKKEPEPSKKEPTNQCSNSIDQCAEPSEVGWFASQEANPSGEDLDGNPEAQPDEPTMPVQETPIPPVPPGPPSPAEQQRSFALLTDPEIGLNAKVAATVAKAHRLEWLLQQAATYWAQYQAGQVNGPGALKNRIANNWRPDEWCSEFLASDYYRRHYPVSLTADEREAWTSYQKYGNMIDSVVGLEHVADAVRALLLRLSDRERYWLEVLPIPGETT